MRFAEFKKDLEVVMLSLDKEGKPVTDDVHKDEIVYQMGLLNHKGLDLQVVLPDINLKSIKSYSSLLYARSFRK